MGEDSKVIAKIVESDITVLNMDSAKTIRYLRTKYPSLREDLDIAFRLEGEEVIRESYTAQDMNIINALCQFGYNGYGYQNLSETFHDEVAICNDDKLNDYPLEYYFTHELNSKDTNIQTAILCGRS